MPRAFTDADIVQQNPGNSGPLSAISVTLPAGTTAGKAGLIVVKTSVPLDPPNQWHTAAAGDVTAGGLYMFCRPDMPEGETSWPFSWAGGAPTWVWKAEEWSNVSFAPMLGSAAGTGAFAASSIPSGTTGSFDAGPVLAVAAFGILRGGGAGATAWPTVSSYSNNFVQADDLQFGDGSLSNDLKLWIARYYGPDGTTGPLSCTATLSGTVTGMVSAGVIAVFRAERFVGEA